MYTNLMIDFGIGLIPVLGDFADVWFKCNTRNNILLERFLLERASKNPVPPPPARKQSAMQRLFGVGKNTSGSHPDVQLQPTAHATSDASAETVSPPDVPAGNGGAAKSGTKAGGSSERNEDLEAQFEEAVHYRRED